MKSFLVTTGLCMIALVGCSNNTTETAKPAEPAPKQESQANNAPDPNKPLYRVLTYPSYTPYEFLDEQGQIIGFDIDMIKEIAKNQGFEVQIINSPWNSMLERLDKDEADLVISGISRQQSGGAEKYALSQAYLHGRDAILTKENVTDINTMNDLAKRTVGVQINTIFADELIKRKGENSPTLVQAPTSYLAFGDLMNGKVEAVYAHENILRHYAKEQPNVKFNFSGKGEGFNVYDMVVVAKKGNDELINKINAGIQAVHQDGTYQKLHTQWFGVEPIKPEQANTQ